jgi:hypothetical protein
MLNVTVGVFDFDMVNDDGLWDDDGCFTLYSSVIAKSKVCCA